MSTTNDLPKVLIKRKNIQVIFDYCLDNKIEFSVKDKPFTVEEFEVTLQITEIKKAIGFGIFARENKIDIVGVTDQAAQQTKNAATKKPATPATPAAKQPEPEVKKEPEAFSLIEDTKKPEPEADNSGLALDLSSSLNLS